MHYNTTFLYRRYLLERAQETEHNTKQTLTANLKNISLALVSITALSRYCGHHIGLSKLSKAPKIQI